MPNITIDPKLKLSKELAKYSRADRAHIMAVAEEIAALSGPQPPTEPYPQPVKPKRTYKRKALGGGIPEGGPALPTE